MVDMRLEPGFIDLALIVREGGDQSHHDAVEVG